MHSSTIDLGGKGRDLVSLTRAIKAGLSYKVLERFQRTSQLPLATLGKVIQIPPRTLARRKRAGRLTRQESERLLRLAGLFNKATELFEGDAAAAKTWFTARNRALASQAPLEMAETEVGARAVEDLIGRLEHGAFS